MALHSFGVLLFCFFTLTGLIPSSTGRFEFASEYDITQWDCTLNTAEDKVNLFKTYMDLLTKKGVYRSDEPSSGNDIPLEKLAKGNEAEVVQRKLKEEMIIDVPEDQEVVPYNNPEQFIDVPSQNKVYQIRIPDKQITIPSKTDYIDVNIPKQVVEVPRKVKIVRLVTPAHNVVVPEKKTQFKLLVPAKRVLVPGKLHQIKVVHPGGRLVIPEEKNLIKLLRNQQQYPYSGLLDVAAISETKTNMKADLASPKVETFVEKGNFSISVVPLGYSGAKGWEGSFRGSKPGSFEAEGWEGSFRGSKPGSFEAEGWEGSFSGSKPGSLGAEGWKGSFRGSKPGSSGTEGWEGSFRGSKPGSSGAEGWEGWWGRSKPGSSGAEGWEGSYRGSKPGSSGDEGWEGWWGRSNPGYSGSKEWKLKGGKYGSAGSSNFDSLSYEEKLELMKRARERYEKIKREKGHKALGTAEPDEFDSLTTMEKVDLLEKGRERYHKVKEGKVYRTAGSKDFDSLSDDEKLSFHGKGIKTYGKLKPGTPSKTPVKRDLYSYGPNTLRKSKFLKRKSNVLKSKSGHPSKNASYRNRIAKSGKAIPTSQRRRRATHGFEEEMSTGADWQFEDDETVVAIIRNVRSTVDSEGVIHAPKVKRKASKIPKSICKRDCQCDMICSYFQISRQGMCNDDKICECLI